MLPLRVFHEPRLMITNAKNWAAARGLSRKNEVHGADEFKVPTDSNFEFTSSKRREAEGSGSMEIEDPDGTLLNFGDLTEENAILSLDSLWFFTFFSCTYVIYMVCIILSKVLGLFAERTHNMSAVAQKSRRGTNGAAVNQVAAQSAAAAKLASLPMVQQNQDPYCF